MKIVFDAEDFKNRPRGIVKTTLCLYRACQRIMPDIQFIGLTRKPLAVSLPDGFKCIQYHPNMPRDVWRFIMYNAYLTLNSCDILHFPSNGLIPLLWKEQNTVLTLHDVLPLAIPDYFTTRSKKIRYFRRRQIDLNRAKIVFTVSEYSKRDILKYFNVRTEPIVLYNAPTLEPDTMTTMIPYSPREDFYLYTGGYDRRKGLVPLLKVFIELHRTRRITSKLYLTGSKSDFSDEFVSLLKSAIDSGIVKEFDYISDQELISLMRRARALIYPSSYEGFGLPPLEAMHVGCPVITTRASSIPEVCGDAALYIDPDNELEFADTILSFHGNDLLRRELIIKGEAQSRLFSWDKTARTYLEHITRLAGRA
jgi:glycosyltransferase involved in cell wall biosynthesis